VRVSRPPRVACNQALEVLGRQDIQVVPADDGLEEFRVLLHHKGREVELALRHEFGLFGQLVVGQTDIQLTQVGIRKKLPEAGPASSSTRRAPFKLS
jgi:hypothetical protein